jgi:elongation factor Ts
MAEITAKLVQELRQQTGAGMMDCKKALKETDGDVATAAEWLRKKGIASAGKKSDRITAEGLVEQAIADGGKSGVLIEVNCQTDFVARNDAFKNLTVSLANQALTTDSVEALLAQSSTDNSGTTVEEVLKESIAKIGENINVRRLVNYKVSGEGIVDSYIHIGGRVGVLIELGTDSSAVAKNPEFQSLARSLAMQVSACPNVEYVNVDEIPSEIVTKEKEIEMGRDDLGNKPENIKEKIVQGRIEKRLKEMTLIDQPYIRDQNLTIAELMAKSAKELGGSVEVRRFTRFILGEGIEKKESNFAEEVAAQMGGLV